MSGIYIPGMEMPRGCAFCKIKKRNGKKMVCPFSDEEWDIHDPMSSEFRLSDCPLVPVPDHGRLIDADAHLSALEKYRNTYEQEHKLPWGITLDAFEWELTQAPTVIPADEPLEKIEQLKEATE